MADHAKSSLYLFQRLSESFKAKISKQMSGKLFNGANTSPIDQELTISPEAKDKSIFSDISKVSKAANQQSTQLQPILSVSKYNKHSIAWQFKHELDEIKKQCNKIAWSAVHHSHKDTKQQIKKLEKMIEGFQKLFKGQSYDEFYLNLQKDIENLTLQRGVKMRLSEPLKIDFLKKESENIVAVMTILKDFRLNQRSLDYLYTPDERVSLDGKSTDRKINATAWKEYRVQKPEGISKEVDSSRSADVDNKAKTPRLR